MLFGKKVETIVKVDGMKCPHCKAKVEMALKAIDGVKKVVANIDTKEVIITSKFEIDKDVIITVVAEAGFTVL
jgi:copper chaperone CopZ